MAPFRRSIGTAVTGFSYCLLRKSYNKLHFKNLLHQSPLLFSSNENKFVDINDNSNIRCHRCLPPLYSLHHQRQSHPFPPSIPLPRPYLPSSTRLKASPIITATTETIGHIRLPKTISAMVGSSSGDVKAIFCMTLLAFQFGCQPILTKKFTPEDINRSSVVLTQDIVKFVMAGVVLVLSGEWGSAIAGWDVRTWLTVACIPASLYCVQNFATLIAYQSLDPLTFNFVFYANIWTDVGVYDLWYIVFDKEHMVLLIFYTHISPYDISLRFSIQIYGLRPYQVLNQTKTLSAALCCYLVMGKMQSSVQVVALLLLFISACIMEKIIPLKMRHNISPNLDEDDSAMEISQPNENDDISVEGSQTPRRSTKQAATDTQQHTRGVCAVLLASFISGLAGALTQRSLQNSTGGGRNSYLLTMEFCVASVIVMLTSALRSEDGRRIRSDGFFHGWTWWTFVPVLTNAAGGIVVGLVTKYAGAVKKGFALIFGLLLSGILQACMKGRGGEDGGGAPVSREQVVGGVLAGLSLWMHSAYPVR